MQKMATIRYEMLVRSKADISQLNLPHGTAGDLQEDRLLSHLTRKQGDDRYDVNQLGTEPWIPNQDETSDQGVMVSSVESSREIEKAKTVDFVIN